MLVVPYIKRTLLGGQQSYQEDILGGSEKILQTLMYLVLKYNTFFLICETNKWLCDINVNYS